MEGHLARGGPITAVFWTRPNPCESTVSAIWPPHVIASVLVRVHVCKCVWPSKVSLTQLVPGSQVDTIIISGQTFLLWEHISLAN